MCHGGREGGPLGGGFRVHTRGVTRAKRSSYLPLVPFDPFPSTLFIVTFTLLLPGSSKDKRAGMLVSEAGGKQTFPLKPH